MNTFEESGLNPQILMAIKELGYEKPTPIQQKAIPHLLETGKDFIGLAQTGTGKTAAFGLPLLHKLDPNVKDVQALILSPTRELCLQIGRDLDKYAKHLPKVNVIAVYGGADMDKQIRGLRKSPQVVAGTPGRTLDLIRRRKLNLSGIRYIVLDEADEMLKMGFKDDLDAILAEMPEDKQSLLFSATMPREIERIARQYMDDPLMVSAGERNTGAKNVRHWYYAVKPRSRYHSLKRIVDLHPKIYGIIFCRTRLETKEIADQLMQDGYNADAIHGDLSQAQRDQVMGRFRKRGLQLLVATDVAARGLDIDDLTHVINFRLPDSPEVYVHRSGRTGRAGKNGVCISLIDPREMRYINIIERKVSKKFEQQKVPDAQEIVAKQLFNYIDRVQKVDVDASQLSDFMEKVYEMMKDLSREEVINQFVALEFERFFDYYKNAGNLSVEIPERGGRRGDKTMYSRFFISLGSKDNLTPSQLMTMINDLPGMRGAPVGKIEIMKKFSFFEVDSSHEAGVLEHLNGLEFDGRAVVVERTKDKPKSSPSRRGGGGGGGGYRGGGGGGGGYRGGGGGGKRPYKKFGEKGKTFNSNKKKKKFSKKDIFGK